MICDSVVVTVLEEILIPDCSVLVTVYDVVALVGVGDVPK